MKSSALVRKFLSAGISSTIDSGISSAYSGESMPLRSTFSLLTGMLNFFETM